MKGKMNRCRDCKWCQIDDYPSSKEKLGLFDKCSSPKRWREITYCEIHRDEGWFGAHLLRLCGKSGRFFVPANIQEEGQAKPKGEKK